ncbi:wd repeat domain 62 isoform g [Holotrichia oblita]|uniref:Wd repeat domain 62 isoform g n=1 Tax=Holotrichia oblita TaxID=644536 RepID=A0ACB9SIF9_HOLOL|nr:wd repeat domain 62 isoform g [Holotrichia oblita]
MENFVQHQANPKILRAPSLKRGKQDDRITDRIKLEKVLGVTVSTNSALDSNPHSEIVAYPAGIEFSECGHQPAVRVWDLQSDPQSGGHPGLYPQVQQVAEFLSHKYGICCVAFSPTNKYVVSIGTQHDMIVNVWDWRNNIKVASNKVSTKVKSLAFSENGSYFVTVGNRHVKFWFLEYGKAKYKEAVPLMGRSAILGEQRNNYFCDVACGKGECGDSTYAITRSGLLCEFNNRRLLDKWVELRTTSANCIAVGKSFIFVGCAEGIVRCFDPLTLKFITTLPRTHYLGVDVSLGTNITHMSTPPNDAKYPDTIAITYDEVSNKLTCIYNDHSVYVWDVHNIKRVGKSHSFLYHSACIWGVEMAPPNSPLPPGSFLTCSSDDTIRVWSLDKVTEKNSRGMYKRNIYSNELLKVVYVDEDLTYLKDLDISANSMSNEKQDTSYDGRNGVRCIRLSPDGKHLASGDRAGNIRIHDTSTMERLLKIEAHDAEVLCLEYSGLDTNIKLMTSASRDRLIHVFDVNRDYDFLQTLDDHSSSITAVRLLNTTHGNLQMVSCGADKSLIFRSLGGTPNGNPQFIRGHNATGKTTLYDMEIDAGQKHVLTACQDRNVRIYSVSTGKHTKSFKGSTGDDGTLIKVVLDRSGIYLATSCTDKSLSVYDYYTGECMATMCGHSELATGLRFTNDCRRLISASGDGCIFVWRVPHDMVVTMHARLSQQAMRQGKTLDNEIFSDGQGDLSEPNPVDNDYRFNIGQLPLWAKKHISEDTSPPVSLTKGVVAPKGRWAQRAERSVGVKSFYTSDSVIPFPGMQERRADSDGSKDSSLDSGTEIKQYSEMRREIIITRQDEEFTVCSESFNEINKSPPQISPSNINVTRGGEQRRNLFTDDSALGSLRDPDNESTAHDGDIDSDQEYRHQPLYYPTQIDSASGSEFTITNIDADELRKSIRKSKKSNLAPITIQQPVSISGSQDSDDDEDDASTPSGENTDRNPMSILSLSSESLDQLASREKYLQSTFESLSGAEIESPINKSSISSQYHTTRTNGTPSANGRNLSVINAARQTKNDPDTIKRREELSKMIADTKKKLANVGHNSPLKYSKSIHDLSYIPEKDKWGSGSSASASGRTSKQGNEPYVSEYERNDTSSSSIITVNNPITVQSFAHDYQLNRSDFPYAINDTNSEIEKATRNSLHDCNNLASSISLPVDLQLCGCHMRDIMSSTFNQPNSAMKLSDMLQKSPEKSQKDLAAMIKPRKLQLDKTLTKYKMHKSLPVSPVSEECRLADFVAQTSKPQKVGQDDFSTRRSFSYFVDFKDETDRGFKQICDDIEKFSRDFVKDYDICLDEKNNDDDANFSSDSLEDCSFNSTRNKKPKDLIPPRRCVSNNEIYKYQTEETDYTNFYHSYDCDIPKSESFYLNPSNKNSQDSILSEDNFEYDYNNRSKSYCNSLESVLSNESDCKSAPLEVLFTSQKKTQSNGEFSKSLPKNITNEFYNYKNYDQYLKPYSNLTDHMKRSQTFTASESTTKVTLRTSQTQTELNYRTPEEIVSKKLNVSSDFQRKLLKFESCIATNQPELAKIATTSKKQPKKSIAFFVEADESNPKQKQSKSVMKERNEDVKLKRDNSMHIPTLESKNRQYKSKFCNILNNKPEFNIEIFESGNKPKNTSNFTLTNFNFDHRPNKNHNIQETSSLDRHLLSKGLLDSEKICHKPPKAVRRHSSKNRKGKTSYEYIRKDDFFRDLKNHNNSKKINCSNENLAPTLEKTIEFHYKEKNLEKDCENGNTNTLFTELYDSLDKPISNTKMDHDSLEINLNNDSSKIFDSLEIDVKNVFAKNTHDDEFNVWKEKPHKTNKLTHHYPTAIDRIQFALQNIKILNEIQKKIHKINNLVDIFKQNMCVGKVRALSSMYESLTNSKSFYNDLTKHQMFPAVKFRRRNLSLPNFVERRLNYECHKKNNVQSSSGMDDSKRQQVHLDSDNPDTSLRRSCSLSDLSMPNAVVQPKRKIDQVSGKLAKSTSTTRANSRYSKSLSITRSSSTGVLNQSDSENETVEKKAQSRLMRPTISSLNKLANVKSTNIRKRHSHSVMNLSTVGNEDSSSEDGEKRLIQMKPTAPPRTRNLNSDPTARKMSNNKESKPKSKFKSDYVASIVYFEKFPAINRVSSVPYDKNKDVDLDSTLTSVFDDSTEDLDVSTVQLSTQLCDEVALQLTKAANNVVELYRRLTDVDANTSEQLATVQKTDMVKNLELSITRTQKMLQELQLERIRRNNGLDVNQTDTVKKLNDLASRGLTNDQNTVVTMMQQYSDILLGLMQQKIQNTNNT